MNKNKIYKEIDNNTLKKLHDIEIEILSEIIRICNKHNIKYFLIGGTLLGAVRHKGFIPWDDDLDIGMMRDDYNKFIKYGIKEINDKYFIHCNSTDPNYWLPFIKVRKNNTTFVEELLKNSKVLHNGIFVDIFPIDNCNNIYFINYIRAFFIRSISDYLLVKRNIVNINESRHPKLNRILNLFNINFLLKLQNKLFTIKKNKNTKKIACFAGAYHIKKEMVSIESAFPLATISFEKLNCLCYNEYDKYLSSLYGDYMQLPPKEDRINHGAHFIDFENGANIKSNKNN